MNTIFKSDLSGSTLTSVFIVGNQLFAGNVGDSRSILISHHPIEKEFREGILD